MSLSSDSENNSTIYEGCTINTILELENEVVHHHRAPERVGALWSNRDTKDRRFYHFAPSPQINLDWIKRL